jgi:hypothetical protein
MTVIRLDATTLAQFRAASGEVVLADETGTPVRRCLMSQEPELTEAEWQEIENDPVTYSLEEAWEKIRRGETL